MGLFTLLRDYSIICDDILVIGGAMLHRELCFIKGMQHEKEAVEQLKPRDIFGLADNVKYIISHQAPSVIEFDFDIIYQDKKIDVEREYLTSIYNFIQPILWIHGHIHQYKIFNNIISLDCVD
jgi:hypothetical protein